MGNENLFLLPAEARNLQVSIYSPIQQTLLEQHLSPHVFDHVIRSLAGEPVHCWAFGSGSFSNFQHMKQNDIVLFRANGSTSFCVKGRVASKTAAPVLGKAIPWRCDGHQWEYIFFVKGIEKVNLSFQKVCLELGYNVNYWLPGSKRVADDRVAKVTAKYGSLEGFIRSMQGPAPASSGTRTIIVRKARVTKEPDEEPGNATLVPTHDVTLKDEDWKI